MSDTDNNRETWLIASWPGMGSVGVGACAHLTNNLGADLLGEIHGEDHFELEHIEVRDGLAQPPVLPRSLMARWKNPGDGPDLLIFLSEAQPSVGKFAFCGKVLDLASKYNVSRVVTFASMATQLHPSAEPSVFAAATDEALLGELKRLEVRVLEEGQIGGMNGVLIAAASERGLPAACLLGEIPFYAAGVPNPKASKRVLETFCVLAGIELDLSELTEQAVTVEKGLIELLEQMQEAARQASEGDEPSFDVGTHDEDEEHKREALDFATRQEIEDLFTDARRDRAKAVKLKETLDRLGVFNQYEDRFLDLFRRGE